MAANEDVGADAAKGEAEIALHGCDVKKGIINCGGSMESYIDILKTVYKSGIAKIVTIKELYGADNIDELKIEVHALKSVAASIGAESLSALALKLEKAAGGKDIATLDSHMQELLDEYKLLLDSISENLPKEDELVISDNEIPAEKMKELLQGALEACQGYDLDSTAELLKEIFTYKIEETTRNAITQIIDYADSFSYKDVEDSITELLEQVAF